MERIGVEPHVIEVCLGHTLKGVAGTYRHYGYLPEKARALQAWADELLPACGDGPRAAPGEVGGPMAGAARLDRGSSEGRMVSGDARCADDSRAAAE